MRFYTKKQLSKLLTQAKAEGYKAGLTEGYKNGVQNERTRIEAITVELNRNTRDLLEQFKEARITGVVPIIEFTPLDPKAAEPIITKLSEEFGRNKKAANSLS